MSEDQEPEENGADPSSFADFVDDHEQEARTGVEIPEEPRDTLPMPEGTESPAFVGYSEAFTCPRCGAYPLESRSEPHGCAERDPS